MFGHIRSRYSMIKRESNNGIFKLVFRCYFGPIKVFFNLNLSLETVSDSAKKIELNFRVFGSVESYLSAE